MTDHIPGYDEYVAAYAEERYDDAMRHLLDAIFAAKEMGAAPVLAGLAQRFGSLLLKRGEALGALVMYELSETLDPGSLLAKLDYAKFLLREMGDRTAAIKKSEEVVSAATLHPFPESDDDFSSDDYIEAAKRVITDATRVRRTP